MTRAEPGGTLAQNSWRSSKQASASGTSKRMSLEAYSMILTTRAAHAGDWISSLCETPRRVSATMERLGRADELRYHGPDRSGNSLHRGWLQVQRPTEQTLQEDKMPTCRSAWHVPQRTTVDRRA